MLGRAAALFIHETLETFGHDQRGCTKLDDLYLTTCDEQIKRAAADSGKSAGIIHAHADRLR